MCGDLQFKICVLLILLGISIFFEYEFNFLNQVQETISIQYTKPYIEIYNSTEHIVTVRVAVYASTSTIYVVPYVARPNGSQYAPAVILKDRYINQNIDLTEIGFVNITGISAKPIVINNSSYNMVAFQVQTNRPFNITFNTGESYVPALQVYVSMPLQGYQLVYSAIIPLNSSS